VEVTNREVIDPLLREEAKKGEKIVNKKRAETNTRHLLSPTKRKEEGRKKEGLQRGQRKISVFKKKKKKNRS